MCGAGRSGVNAIKAHCLDAAAPLRAPVHVHYGENSRPEGRLAALLLRRPERPKITPFALDRWYHTVHVRCTDAHTTCDGRE